MWVNKEHYGDMQNRIEKLGQENINLKNELKMAKHRINILEEDNRKFESTLNDESEKCNVAVNYELMEAFSIERLKCYGSWCTNIGYFQKETRETKEWRIYCSNKIHENLVQQFNGYLKNFLKGKNHEL